MTMGRWKAALLYSKGGGVGLACAGARVPRERRRIGTRGWGALCGRKMGGRRGVR